jgi:hypothetical protein
VAEPYRLPALYDPGEAYGPPAAWWEVGWDDQLVSFTARLVAEPADDGDLVEVEPVTVIGQRIGELVDVPELVERIEVEDPAHSVRLRPGRQVGSRSGPLSGGFEPAGIARAGRASGGELRPSKRGCRGNRLAMLRQVAKAG